MLLHKKVCMLGTFGVAFFATLATGFALWMPIRKQRAEMRLRDGFIVVVMFSTSCGSNPMRGAIICLKI